jgi:hypothetical protein
MLRRKTDLETLADRARRIEQASGADIRLLGGDQLLIRKNMIDSPTADALAKAPAQVPGKEGYECYVRTSLWKGPEGPLVQRMRPPELAAPIAWQPDSMKLVMTPDQDQAEWEVLLRRTTVVTVRVRRGSDAPCEEVNHFLAVIEETLLR